MEALQPFDYGTTCWWCFGPADSSEHKYKRTDIVSEFGRPPYRGESALVRHVGDDIVAGGIQGPNSNHFKFEPGLCQLCNSAKSRPFDLAYESLVSFIRRNEENILRERTLDLALAFGHDWAPTLEGVRRYFVKHACCRISDARLRVGDDLVSFLDGENPNAPFYLFAEIRTDLLELFGTGAGRSGSLWLGGLVGWHAPGDSRIVRVESHYGMGWLRFYWTYDPLARDWSDNMRRQVVALPEGRNLAQIQEDESG